MSGNPPALPMRPHGCALLAVSTLAAALICGGAHAAGRQLIGRSVEGRGVYAREVGAPGGRPVLVVGCIHGNEPAGIAIAQALERLAPPAGVDLWIVETLNPDGRAAHTRGDARGVDLNRNFPYAWRRLEPGPFFSGPRSLSEPETRAAYRLIRRIKPVVSIWFHQSLGVVDDSQGSRALERRFAHLVGLPVETLPDYRGSAVSWENHALPGTTAFVVELHAGWLTALQARRYARAVREVVGRKRPVVRLRLASSSRSRARP